MAETGTTVEVGKSAGVKCDRKKCRRFAIGFVAFALPCVVAMYWVIEHNLGLRVPAVYYWVTGPVVGAIGALRAGYGQRFSWFESWKTFDAIASGKAMTVITLALTIVPITVSISNEVGAGAAVPFTLYLYWISGLSLSLFLLVYKVSAPAAYRFATLTALTEKEGSVLCLREDAQAALRQMGVEMAAHDPAFVEQDKAVLTKLAAGTVEIDADVYFVMRRYSAEFKTGIRAVLSILLIIPAFLVPTVTAIKITAVGYQANVAAGKLGGWAPAIYHQLFDLREHEKQ